MEKVSASKAAKLVGKTTPTITKACKTGKMSAEKNPNGGFMIDVSELYRVFPPVRDGINNTAEKPPNNATNIQTYTPKNLQDSNALRVEVEALRDKVSMIESERERERSDLVGQIADLKDDKERLQQEAERATRQLENLMTDPAKSVELVETVKKLADRVAATEARSQRGFFGRVFGR
jgi:uncharacterized phage infection (PIP) family protein YhgE|tara:strand:+ start:317 stop:850 length:534 start_codon:yes stop_codon:yes gene_type:complete